MAHKKADTDRLKQIRREVEALFVEFVEITGSHVDVQSDTGRMVIELDKAHTAFDNAMFFLIDE